MSVQESLLLNSRPRAEGDFSFPTGSLSLCILSLLFVSLGSSPLAVSYFHLLHLPFVFSFSFPLAPDSPHQAVILSLSFFFFSPIFIYLAAAGLNFGTWGSLIVAAVCGF